MRNQSKKAATMTRPVPVVTPTRAVEIETKATGQPCPQGAVTLDEAVRVRAYEKWVQAGRPDGDGISFWLEAESELRACR